MHLSFRKNRKDAIFIGVSDSFQISGSTWNETKDVLIIGACGNANMILRYIIGFIKQFKGHRKSLDDDERQERISKITTNKFKISL